VIRERPALDVRSLLERLRFPALAILGVLVAHDTVFAAQYGLGRGMDRAMDGTWHAYWPAFVVLTLLVVAAGAGAAARVILGLRRLVRGLPDTPAPRGPGYLREVAHLWPRLLAVVTVAFVVQENIEHLLAGRPMPGLWALSAPGYPLAVPVLVAVTGLLAIVGGWLQWQREALAQRLAAARRAAALRRRQEARAPHDRWALLSALLAHRWILLRRDAERAPPLALRA
jgi:hypothetical protein